MDLRPLPDHAALLVDGSILAVADLHIGLEEQLAEAGVHIPPQAEKMAGEIEALASEHGAKTLVVLGDVKHFVPKMASRERRDVYLFFPRLPATLEAAFAAPGAPAGVAPGHVPPPVNIPPTAGMR